MTVDYPNTGVKCECVGGCCMVSMGYHPNGHICNLNMKPGLPWRTMENPRQRVRRWTAKLSSEGEQQYDIAMEARRGAEKELGR